MMMGGGAPPMDPSMMMGGGAPPMDPSMMGGGAPPDLAALLQPMIQQAVQQAMAGAGGGGAAAGGGASKAKIDVGTEMHQIKLLLGKMADAMGIQLSAAEMFSAPADMPQSQPQPQPQGMDPAAGGMGRIAPMKAAGAREAWEHGEAFYPTEEPKAPSFSSTADRARALLMTSR